MPIPPKNLDKRITGDLISTTEAADILGMTRQAVINMAIDGRLAGAMVGTFYVFRRSVVERVAARRKERKDLINSLRYKRER